ncbi:MAG TPA: cupredoxin family copper-binding protein [Pyrinomonadaceae bacterium]
MKIRSLVITTFLIFVGIALVGCGSGGVIDNHEPKMPVDKPANSSIADASPEKGEVRIEIEDFVFKPAEITIAPGTKVTWINKDEAPHTATSTDTPQKFNSGGLDTDDKFSFVFNDKGEYPYYCALHPHMKASITVK